MKKFLAILIAAAFLAIAAMPAMAQAPIEDRITNLEKQLAACWKFYGSVRMQTYYSDWDPKNGTAKTKGTVWGLQGNSRIGARVTVGDISGRVEMGYAGDRGAAVGTNNAVLNRYLFGTWNFGSGTLLLGQDDTPMVWTVNGRVYGSDRGLWGGGGQFYGHRVPQIKLLFGKFQFAMIDPSRGGTGYKVVLPRFEASYDLKFDALTGRVVAGYKTYKEGDAANNKSVSAYVLGLALKYAPGPFYAGLTGFYAQNVQNFTGNDGNGMSIRAPNGLVSGYGAYNLAAEKNAKDWGVHAAVGYKVNDMVTFEAGYGHQESKRKNAAGGNAYNVKSDVFYVNVPLTIAKNVWIVPEFGVESYKDKELANSKLGRLSYFGAKWQINF